MAHFPFFFNARSQGGLFQALKGGFQLQLFFLFFYSLTFIRLWSRRVPLQFQSLLEKGKGVHLLESQIHACSPTR